MFFALLRNPKFAEHPHVPLTHLGGTSRCFARQNCRAEHVNVPLGPLQRGGRCFAIFGLGRGGAASSGTGTKQERRLDRMVKSPFCGADEARKSTQTSFINPCRSAFYCVSLPVMLLDIAQNWGIIGARFNKETL